VSGRPPQAPLVVAVDGAAGSGKSTLSSALARRLGLPYLNTGVMYRALAHRAIEHGVDASDVERLVALLRDLRFELSAASGDPPQLLVQGRAPSDELSSPGVEAIVSEVAAHPDVRRVLVATQRRLGGGGGVIEGRDIGTVVFPGAPVKIFLAAEPAERVARRIGERRRGDPPDAALAEALHRRDAKDARTNPHVPAPGATIIDTTGLSAEEVLDRAAAIVSQRLSES
jgi:cytidylate kinase